MPEMVENVEFGPWQRGRPSKYGFPEFEPGKTYLCRPGRDYDSDVVVLTDEDGNRKEHDQGEAHFRAAAYSWGRNHGLRTRTRVVDGGIAIRFEELAA